MPRINIAVIVLSLALCAHAQNTLPVQMLVPGFTVREIPIQLTNINNLEYTADGRLWALGYDGRIHILTDSDGDGLEDKSLVWWQPKDANAFRGPIGMVVRPEGVYVASKGKISLIKDTDKDGKADLEDVVTTGWKETYTAVDTTGLAIDKDGNIYFGLGCADFANAYQLDKQGKAQYDINSHHGTIQKLSPDRKKREAVATGVRFAIGIAINRHGDLFWTDQEGDTWTKGNHLDELNVLLPGKQHYGFPEKHPVHLPNVTDIEPVIGFGPQHQSTCGLKFNEAREGFKTFGPTFWENDALIIGQSRGKIWRVPLHKTAKGYTGRQCLIACTQMLTIDCAISPPGDMVICCHSGPPDWGTGPTGKGRLFKISYTDKTAPQPTHAWALSKDEIAVTFDRAIDKSIESRLKGLTLSYGEYVRAGDRYETMRPPYVVVKAQLQTPTRDLKITSAALAVDGKTLSIEIEDMPWRAWYALAIPGVKLPGQPGLGSTIDVDFEVAGAKWARLPKQPVVEKPEEPKLTQGGDWARGKELFFGEAKCATCHVVRGEGSALGPNLSNLVHVNPESVLLDIVQPTARINPDYISFIVETKDGDTHSGTVRMEQEKVIITQAADMIVELKRDQVKAMRPSALSIMPDGYKDILGEAKLRDLLTFLTKERVAK